MARSKTNTRTVAFRLEEGEYLRLAKAAQGEEQSPGAHARNLVRGALDDAATVRLLDDVERLRDAVGDLAAELRAVAAEVKMLRVLLCRATEVLLTEAGHVGREEAAAWVQSYLRREGVEPCSA